MINSVTEGERSLHTLTVLKVSFVRKIASNKRELFAELARSAMASLVGCKGDGSSFDVLYLCSSWFWSFVYRRDSPGTFTRATGKQIGILQTALIARVDMW